MLSLLICAESHAIVTRIVLAGCYCLIIMGSENITHCFALLPAMLQH